MSTRECGNRVIPPDSGPAKNSEPPAPDCMPKASHPGPGPPADPAPVEKWRPRRPLGASLLLLTDDFLKLGLVLLFPSRPRFRVQHACRLRLPDPLPRIELHGLGGGKLSRFAFGHGPRLRSPRLKVEYGLDCPFRGRAGDHGRAGFFHRNH